MTRPLLISMAGLPGTGKSTLAVALSAALKFPVFSVDPIESAILRAGVVQSFETGLAAYLVAETLAAEQLTLGFSVIIDAVNSVPEARRMWSGLAARHGVRLIMVECLLAPEIHRERIEARTRNLFGFAEVTWADVERRRAEYAPWDQERLIVDTAQPIEVSLDQIKAYIASTPAQDFAAR